MAPASGGCYDTHSRGLIQRWVRITDAAMHEKPRGFGGFRVSPAAFLIDGIEHRRMPPDWMYRPREAPTGGAAASASGPVRR